MNLLKRTISIVSAIAISASIVISAMAAGFTDVSEQSPYYDAISYTSEAVKHRFQQISVYEVHKQIFIFVFASAYV